MFCKKNVRILSSVKDSHIFSTKITVYLLLKSIYCYGDLVYKFKKLIGRKDFSFGVSIDRRLSIANIR